MTARAKVGWPERLDGAPLLIYLALRDLYSNTRRPYYAREIAEVAGLATSTVQQRLRTLETSGHVRRRIAADRSLLYTPI